jgi:hypothetical protein
MNLRIAKTCRWSLAVFATVAFTACSSPNKANIDLRKQNQQLQGEVDSLKRQHEADVATIRALEAKSPDVASLPQERINQLFTVNGLQFGKLTGADPDDPKKLKVYVVPTDGQGQQIKAAGSFVVEAFDLSGGDNARIGRWEFPLDQAAKNWYGQAMLYSYVLSCPWQSPPRHSDITIKVTFTDALTGRQFTAQKSIKVPAAS